MPILTEKEMQDIVNKETEANAKIEEKNKQINEIYKENEDVKSQKRAFMISTILIGILFFALLFTVIFQPSTLNLNTGVNLAEGEEIVKSSTLKSYQERILELEANTSQYINPLELQEFYAVQLGAFKKFNTKLTSDSYSVVHNGNFKDFNLYTLGVFETQEEAEKLRKVVRQLNFKDAFVGFYKDGERVKSNY